ncbi:hypothetical protein U1839_21025 [Sphingomonas sp. RT2P30]
MDHISHGRIHGARDHEADCAANLACEKINRREVNEASTFCPSSGDGRRAFWDRSVLGDSEAAKRPERWTEWQQRLTSVCKVWNSAFDSISVLRIGGNGLIIDPLGRGADPSSLKDPKTTQPIVDMATVKAAGMLRFRRSPPGLANVILFSSPPFSRSADQSWNLRWLPAVRGGFPMNYLDSSSFYLGWGWILWMGSIFLMRSSIDTRAMPVARMASPRLAAPGRGGFPERALHRRRASGLIPTFGAHAGRQR